MRSGADPFRSSGAWAALLALLLLVPFDSFAQRDMRPGSMARKAGEHEAAVLARELDAVGSRASATGRSPKVIHVFGDSYSDTGNGYVRFAATLPGFFSPPYAVPRYSNGPMWPDYLGQAIGSPITAVVSGGTNYAIGAATISPENYYNLDPYVSGFAMVDRFLAANGSADPRAIYVVWLGANDIDPPAAFTEWSFEQLVKLLRRLHDAGARRFLVPTLPDIGKLPLIVDLGDAVYAQQLSEMTVLFNQRLASLPARFPEAKIQLADVYRLKTTIDRHPLLFGFSNTTRPCFTAIGQGGNGVVCAHPDQYWFWDPSHPTTRAHKLLASLFLLELLKAGELRLSDLAPGR